MADSVQIAAAGGKEPVDDAQRALLELVRAVLGDRVRMGLDLPEREAEMIAGFVSTRGRLILKKLWFYGYEHGAIHGVEDQNDIPTRPIIRVPTRELAAVRP